MGYIKNNKRLRATKSRPVSMIYKSREAAERKAKSEWDQNKKWGITSIDTYVAKIPDSWGKTYAGQYGVFSKNSDSKLDRRVARKFNKKRRSR